MKRKMISILVALSALAAIAAVCYGCGTGYHVEKASVTGATK